MLVPEVTDTNSEYVTLIAFPLQQWLQEHTLMFLCAYIAACLVTINGSAALEINKRISR